MPLSLFRQSSGARPDHECVDFDSKAITTIIFFSPELGNTKFDPIIIENDIYPHLNYSELNRRLYGELIRYLNFKFRSEFFLDDNSNLVLGESKIMKTSTVKENNAYLGYSTVHIDQIHLKTHLQDSTYLQEVLIEIYFSSKHPDKIYEPFTIPAIDLKWITKRFLKVACPGLPYENLLRNFVSSNPLSVTGEIFQIGYILLPSSLLPISESSSEDESTDDEMEIDANIGSLRPHHSL